MTNRYEGAHVLLTGAASGIGRAIAQRLVSEGALVHALDRDASGLADTKASVSVPEHFRAQEVDLASEPALIDAVAKGVAELSGRVDLLVNNAGAIAPGPAPTIEVAAIDKLMKVNFYAPALICREVLPHVPDHTGVIVNITSTAATKAHPWMSAYAASKGALLAYTISLAAELSGRRIRVVPLSPGGTNTPLTSSDVTFADVNTAWYARHTPLWGEMGEPEDIAAAVAFVGSSDGRYFNGVELRVDGGSHV